MLQFNIEKFRQDVYKEFRNQLQIALDYWKEEVYSKITYSYFRMGAEVNYIIETKGGRIMADLKANNFVLADTFGTGSLMDESSNPWFEEYKNKYWHDDRHGNTIVGRKAGTYTDIFGKPHKTSGKFRGKKIEGIKVFDAKEEGYNNSKNYYISPRYPSYALKLAWQYLDKQWLQIAYKNLANNLDYSKYLIEK